VSRAASPQRPKEPARSNSQPPNTPDDDRRDDLWKTSPSTEISADQGENARRERRRKIAENAPLKKSAASRPSRRR
jgi:hypothetical protein